MNYDKRMFRWLALLMFLPLMLAFFGGERFRYPCQDPANWNTQACQKPGCEIHRQCPEHIFDRDAEVKELIDKQGSIKGAVK